jgi:hypothetical protein
MPKKLAIQVYQILENKKGQIWPQAVLKRPNPHVGKKAKINFAIS